MTGALIILAITVAAGLLLWLTDRGKGQQPGEITAPPPSTGHGDLCCGKHEVCEKRFPPTDLYYDDEELDHYRGTIDYKPEDIETFRDVLYTLPKGEIRDWGAAIEARGITMPDEIREEWRALANEE